MDNKRFDELTHEIDKTSRRTALKALAGLSNLQVAILAGLRGEPTHGWELIKAVRRLHEEMGSPKSIAPSTVYKNIDHLEDLGLVKQVAVEIGLTNRPTRVVALTEEGRKAALIETDRRLREAQVMWKLVHGRPLLV